MHIALKAVYSSMAKMIDSKLDTDNPGNNASPPSR